MNWKSDSGKRYAVNNMNITAGVNILGASIPRGDLDESNPRGFYVEDYSSPAERKYIAIFGSRFLAEKDPILTSGEIRTPQQALFAAPRQQGSVRCVRWGCGVPQ